MSLQDRLWHIIFDDMLKDEEGVQYQEAKPPKQIGKYACLMIIAAIIMVFFLIYFDCGIFNL